MGGVKRERGRKEFCPSSWHPVKRKRRVDERSKAEYRILRRDKWIMLLGMTSGFKRFLEAAAWFVLGFLAHMLLLHYHHHPFR